MTCTETNKYFWSLQDTNYFVAYIHYWLET